MQKSSIQDLGFQGRIRKQDSILSSKNACVKCSSLLIVMPFISIARRFKILFTDIIDLLMCAKDRDTIDSFVEDLNGGERLTT